MRLCEDVDDDAPQLVRQWYARAHRLCRTRHQSGARLARRLARRTLRRRIDEQQNELERFEALEVRAEADAQRSFEMGLLRPLKQSLTPLNERLRPANFETLVHVLASSLAPGKSATRLR